MESSLEEWRDVPGLDRYQVSSFGNVRSKPEGRPITPRWANHTYTVNVTRNDGTRSQIAVARLVALAFHQPRPPGAVARHKDKNPRNNAVSNVYWGSTRALTEDATTWS